MKTADGASRCNASRCSAVTRAGMTGGVGTTRMTMRWCIGICGVVVAVVDRDLQPDEPAGDVFEDTAGTVRIGDTYQVTAALSQVRAALSPLDQAAWDRALAEG